MSVQLNENITFYDRLVSWPLDSGTFPSIVEDNIEVSARYFFCEYRYLYVEVYLPIYKQPSNFDWKNERSLFSRHEVFSDFCSSVENIITP